MKLSYQRKTAVIPMEGYLDRFLPAVVSKEPGTSGLETAIIVQAGMFREMERYFQDLSVAVKGHGQEPHTVIIAPGVPEKACSARKWMSGSKSKKQPKGSQAFVWSSHSRWVFGGLDDSKSKSYFEALDDVVAWAQRSYPGLQKVVLTGNSAGSQSILRWAITSPNGHNGKTIHGLPLTTVVSAPSSVVYLSKERPVKSCSPDEDTGPEHKCWEFKVPSKGDQTTASECKGHEQEYNDYPFATGNLESGTRRRSINRAVGKYISMNDNFDIRSDEVIDDELREAFKTKDIVFVIGQLDKFSCIKYSCSSDCAAMTQGSNRLQRIMNYASYLKWLFPGEPGVGKVGVFSGGHYHLAAFASRAWAKFAFPVDRDLPFQNLVRVAAYEGVDVPASLQYNYNRIDWSLHQCEVLCAGTPGCNSFAHHQLDYDRSKFSGEKGMYGACHLKKQCITAHTPVVRASAGNGQYKTFYRPCEEEGTDGYFSTPRVIADEGKGVEGHRGKQRTVAECARLCDGNSECNSFAYGYGQCFLKEKCVTANEKLVPASKGSAFKTYYKPCSAPDASRLFLTLPSAPARGTTARVSTVLVGAVAAAAALAAVAGTVALVAWRRSRIAAAISCNGDEVAAPMVSNGASVDGDKRHLLG